MGSDESESNDPNSNTDEDLVASMQHTYGSIYAADTAEAINDDIESVILFNEEDEIDTMQELDDIIEMFPEEENDECLRSAL